MRTAPHLYRWPHGWTTVRNKYRVDRLVLIKKTIVLLLIFLALAAAGCSKDTNRGVVGADTWVGKATPTACERIEKFQSQEMYLMLANRRNFDMEAFQERQAEHTARVRREYGLSVQERPCENLALPQ